MPRLPKEVGNKIRVAFIEAGAKERVDIYMKAKLHVGSLLLATILSKISDTYEVRCIVTDIAQPDKRTWKWLSKIDVACFTVLTPNFGPTLDFIRKLRSVNPNVIVIVGGFEPSGNPTRSLQRPEIDYVGIGEGERTIPEFIQALQNGKVHKVNGLAFLDINGKPHFNPPRKRLTSAELNNLPFEDYNLLFDPKKQRTTATVQWSRGCRNR
ncbi:MAG: cobalamin-dependent protein [Patescibacteria group bacterium]|nr:cobalamin-dependent protein [Patescibacteria group bacterium]